METEKRKLRKLVRTYKERFSPDELLEMSTHITEPLAQYLIKKDGISTILLYHSLPDEVSSHQLIENLLNAGKRIILPTVIGDELELHEYSAKSNTHIGYKGIIESDGKLFTDYSKIDIAIIPGMAFTKKGHRLGRGKGYYDRLLAHLSCPLIGLAFPFQILEKLPTEPHDILMDYVVS